MEKPFPERLLRAALPILTGTPRNAPFHRRPLASPSFTGRRALPLASLCRRKTGLLPSLLLARRADCLNRRPATLPRLSGSGIPLNAVEFPSRDLSRPPADRHWSLPPPRSLFWPLPVSFCRPFLARHRRGPGAVPSEATPAGRPAARAFWSKGRQNETNG
jgi:hypothetical protein